MSEAGAGLPTHWLRGAQYPSSAYETRISCEMRNSAPGFSSQCRADPMSTFGPRPHLSGGRVIQVAQHQDFCGARSLADSLDLAESNDEQYSSLQACSRDMKLADARNYLERQVSSAAKPVILVFDEIDYITPGSPTAEHWKKDFNRFWRSLRTIFQECTRNESTLSILVGGVSTYWFVVEQIDGVENAALAFVPEEYLRPMPTGASIAMLRRLGRISGLSISEGAAHYISTATGNIPFWSRKCASYIHRHIDFDARPIDVTQEFVEPLGSKFIQEEGAAIAEVALTHLFRVHPDTEVAARAIFHERHEELSASLFRTVRRY